MTNDNPQTPANQNPPVDHLTNNERAQLAMNTAGELFREVIFGVRNIPNLRPIDLPNVFVSCIAHSMAFFENDLKMPKEVIDHAALLAVVSLVMTLSANGRQLPGVVVPKLDNKHVGLTNNAEHQPGSA